MEVENPVMNFKIPDQVHKRSFGVCILTLACDISQLVDQRGFQLPWRLMLILFFDQNLELN